MSNTRVIAIETTATTTTMETNPQLKGQTRKQIRLARRRRKIWTCDEYSFDMCGIIRPVRDTRIVVSPRQRSLGAEFALPFWIFHLNAMKTLVSPVTWAYKSLESTKTSILSQSHCGQVITRIGFLPEFLDPHNSIGSANYQLPTR